MTMTKILHKEIESCSDCPYAHQDHQIVICLMANGENNIIISSYDEMLTKKEIPDWCPLDNLTS